MYMCTRAIIHNRTNRAGGEALLLGSERAASGARLVCPACGFNAIARRAAHMYKLFMPSCWWSACCAWLCCAVCDVVTWAVLVHVHRCVVRCVCVCLSERFLFRLRLCAPRHTHTRVGVCLFCYWFIVSSETFKWDNYPSLSSFANWFGFWLSACVLCVCTCVFVCVTVCVNVALAMLRYREIVCVLWAIVFSDRCVHAEAVRGGVVSCIVIICKRFNHSQYGFPCKNQTKSFLSELFL